MKATSKRLLALLAGGLGLRTILRRRARQRFSESPASDLKARLAATKEPAPAQPEHVEPVRVESEPVEAKPVEAEHVEAEEGERPPSHEGVDERRADTHARARHAIEELRGDGD